MLSQVLDIRVAVSVFAVLVGTLLSSTTFAADPGEQAAFKHHCAGGEGQDGESSGARYANLAGQIAA